MTIYNRYNRWSAQGLWHKLFARLAAAGTVPAGPSIDRVHIKAHQLRSWVKNRMRRRPSSAHGADGVSKTHALANMQGKPVTFVLVPGNIDDISVAEILLDDIAPPQRQLADKAYDTNHLSH